MPGLLRRLVRGGASDAPPAPDVSPEAGAPLPPAPDLEATREVGAVALPPAESPPPPPPAEPVPTPAPPPEYAPAPEPTAVPLPAHEPPTVEGLPADTAPGEAGAAPSWRRRAALRRRARYLRRVRELGLRDLGGLVLDLHRFGRERPDLVSAKLASLTALEAERRALEAELGEQHSIDLVREPGLASCPRCGALHPSEARFCAHCGLDLATDPVPADAVPTEAEPVPGAAAATVETHGT